MPGAAGHARRGASVRTRLRLQRDDVGLLGFLIIGVTAGALVLALVELLVGR